MIIGARPGSRAEFVDSIDTEVWRSALSSKLASGEANEIFQFNDGTAKTP